MDKLKKRIFQYVSWICILGMLVSVNPVILRADNSKESNFTTGLTEEEIEKQKALEPGVYTYRGIKEEDEVPSIEKSINSFRRNYASFIPSSYDARNHNQTTSVKNQNPYGTCWAFSAIAVAEAGMIKKGAADNNIDLSELQLAYFMQNSVVDPLGGTEGDKVIKNDYLDSGNTIYTMRTLANWVGVTKEELVPYEKAKEIRTKGLASSLASENDFGHLQDAYIISKEDTNIIKSMIMEYGAAGISYYENDNYRNYSTGAYYNNKNTSENHAVTVVGWDDNYSKDNFLKGRQPAKNGAWLVKNSWGPSWGSAWGGNGYFWMSYEDVSISNACYVFNVESSNNYANNYQYDGGISVGGKSWATGYDAQMANVFTAAGKESLQAVGFYTKVNTPYKIQIYTNLTSDSDPTSGTLVSEQDGTQIFEGYHTVVLNQPVQLNQGTKFAVVITLSATPNTAPYVAIDTTMDGGWIKSKAFSRAGQSFTKYPNWDKWEDIGEKGDCNLRIKAFTNTAVTNPITNITLNQSQCEMKLKDTISLTATATPSNHDDTIRWFSSNDEIVSVTANGELRARKAGKAIITARARSGNASATCEVKVSLRLPATSLTLDKTEIEVMVNNSKQLTGKMEPDDTDDYITWTSSDDSIAEVNTSGRVTGKSKGEAIITATTVSNQTADCKVIVTKMGSGEDTFFLNKVSKKIYKYGEYTILAHTAITKLNPKKVIWSVSSNNVVIQSGGLSGCVIKINNVEPGNKGEKLTISATVSYTTKKGKIKTKVFKKRTTMVNLSSSVQITSSNLIDNTIKIISKKEKIPLSVTLNNGDKNDQPTNTKIKWLITDKEGKVDKAGKKIASVNGKGIVSGKLGGTTYVTAATVDSYDKTVKSYRVIDTIKIVCSKIENIQVTGAALTSEGLILKDKTQKVELTTIINDGDPTNTPLNNKIKWLITDENGIVDKNGKKVASVNGKGIVVGKGPGVTYVAACAQDSYDKSTKKYNLMTLVKVICPPVESISFAEDTPTSIGINSSLDLSKKLIWNPEKPFNFSKMKVKWSSSNKSIATVNSKGLVNTKKTPGMVIITVEAVGGIPSQTTVPSATLNLTVSNGSIGY